MLIARLVVGLSGSSPSAIQQGPVLVDSVEWHAVTAIETSYIGGIQGYVTDKDTGAPIPGVMVSFQLLSTQTDAEGYYEIWDIPTGTQSFLYVMTGYKIAERSAAIHQEEWAMLDVVLTPGEGPEPPPEPTNLLWLWLLLGIGGATIVGIRTKKLLEKDTRS